MLRAGLAKVVKREPFTIQLRYESTEFTQLVTFGIDAGYSHIGFSAVTDREELISGEVKMLQGVKNRLEERAMYRRTRRNHLRYRRNNGVDEHKPLGWLAPSIEHKLETHVRLVDQIKSILPISQVVVEVASFDTHKIRHPDVQGVGYQKGEMFGFDNVREYVLHRDGHKCQNPDCKNKSRQPILCVHHIDMDRTHNHHSNLITLCTKCHTPANHKGILKEWKDKGNKISFKGSAEAFMNSVRWKLAERLEAKPTYGYITKALRRELGIEKTHANDAFVIAGGTTQTRSTEYNVQQNRRNNRSLEQFYDALYIDLRDGEKKKGTELSSGRTKRNKNLSDENLRNFRRAKVRKGYRQIRRERPLYRRGDLVLYVGKVFSVRGTHNKNTRVILEESRKSVAIKKVKIVKYAAGLYWRKAG